MPRPREYDPRRLIDTAVETFWSRGYADTSVEDVVGRSGVNRASLYSAYPGKRALFLAALRRYLETVTEAGLRRLGEGPRASASVRAFLQGIAAQARVPRSRGIGCLLTNTAVELGARDRAAATLIRSAWRRVEDALRERIAEAAAQGDLAPGTDARTLARQLLVLIQGLRVVARVGGDPALVRDAVESALSPLRR